MKRIRSRSPPSGVARDRLRLHGDEGTPRVLGNALKTILFDFARGGKDVLWLPVTYDGRIGTDLFIFYFLSSIAIFFLVSSSSPFSSLSVISWNKLTSVKP